MRSSTRVLHLFSLICATFWGGNALAGSKSALTLNPGTVTLAPGQSQQFTASLYGSPTTEVYWSMQPPVGLMNNGVYTAPAYITSQVTVTLTAFSATDASQSATSVITLVTSTANLSSAPAFSVYPTSATVSGGQSWQFNLAGNANNVAWSVSPAVGSVSNTGLYTAPQSIPYAQTVTVIASKGSQSSQASVYLLATVVNTPPPPPPSPTTPTPSPAPSTGTSGATMTPSTAVLSQQQQTTFKFAINGIVTNE